MEPLEPIPVLGAHSVPGIHDPGLCLELCAKNAIAAHGSPIALAPQGRSQVLRDQGKNRTNGTLRRARRPIGESGNDDIRLIGPGGCR